MSKCSIVNNLLYYLMKELYLIVWHSLGSSVIHCSWWFLILSPVQKVTEQRINIDNVSKYNFTNNIFIKQNLSNRSINDSSNRASNNIRRKNILKKTFRTNSSPTSDNICLIKRNYERNFEPTIKIHLKKLQNI